MHSSNCTIPSLPPPQNFLCPSVVNAETTKPAKDIIHLCQCFYNYYFYHFHLIPLYNIRLTAKIPNVFMHVAHLFH